MICKVSALNSKLEFVSIAEFFSQHCEFSTNTDLMRAVSSNLKVIVRHPDSIPDITTKVDDGYCFSVIGALRTYTITFKLEKDSLVLIKIN